MTVNADRQIERHDAYLDSGDIARQLGVLPPAGSRAERHLTKLANVRTRTRAWFQAHDPKRSPPACGSCAAGSPGR